MLENLLFSLNSTLPLFFLMLLGYVLYRTGFLSDAFVAGANKFVFLCGTAGAAVPRPWQKRCPHHL